MMSMHAGLCFWIEHIIHRLEAVDHPVDQQGAGSQGQVAEYRTEIDPERNP